MIINDVRALAYTAQIGSVMPIAGADNIELVTVGGWTCIAKKGEFEENDYCVYFEIDSKLPETAEWAAFLAPKKFKVKTMKLSKFGVISQGLALPYTAFVGIDLPNKIHQDVTELLGVTYCDAEDNKRKTNSEDKYKKMVQRRPDIFKKAWAKWFMRREWGRKLMFVLFGKKKDKKSGWPVGQFPGVSKTDQERVENMPWVLQNKEPYIVTQKCDGSSGTYILERKPFGRYEFYVCSRNVRMLNDKQECFYGDHNYYWEVAEKYQIEKRMKQYLADNPNVKWVCWQGEICAPGIQKNPHKLTDTHFYCFHWTDSLNGRLDILTAADLWGKYQMDVVPVVDTNYIMPDTLEELKLTADGYYDSRVCGNGETKCRREGFVYYKVSDPTFSFKNVSREYLLRH